MKLDSENDRNVLLGLIANATIKGEHALIIADLMQRIHAAEVPTSEKAGSAQS